MARTIENKISVATVFGKIDRAELYKPENDGRVKVMRVVGIATGFKDGKTIRNLPNGDAQVSEWHALQGQFAATNLATGQVFRAGKCFLPNSGTDLIIGVLAGLGDDSRKAVEFAFDIHAVRDDESAVGYRWEVSSLVEPAKEDPLEKLMAQASNLLAAPETIPPSHNDELPPETEHKEHGKKK